MDLTRVAVIGVTGYILYLELKCPCENIMACSLKNFSIALISLGGLVAFQNFK